MLFDGTTRLRRQDGTPVAMYSMAGLAEYAVVPATDVFALPDSLPFAESAVLGCGIFTAYGAVRHAADLRGGERVAVVAAGGVGLSIIQVAKAFGASQIVAVDISDEKLEAARRFGATDVVNASREDVAPAVKKLTGRRAPTSRSRRWAGRKRSCRRSKASATAGAWSVWASPRARPPRPLASRTSCAAASA